MKKWISLCLALVLCLALAACGGDTAATPTPDAAPTPDAGAEATPDAGDEVPTELAELLANPQGLLADILEKGTLTVAISPDFAPMEFVDTSKSGQDQYVGFDVTLIRYVAEQLGVELVIEAMNLDACQAAVATGSVDMSISGYSYNEERAENFTLSNPYQTGNGATRSVLVLAGQGADYTEVADFDGKVLGVQNGTTYQKLRNEYLPNSVEYIVGDTNTGVLELANGNIDGLCVAKGTAETVMANNPGQFEESEWKFPANEQGDLILMPKGEDYLCAAVNAILEDSRVNWDDWYDEAMLLANSDVAGNAELPE